MGSQLALTGQSAQMVEKRAKELKAAVMPIDRLSQRLSLGTVVNRPMTCRESTSHAMEGICEMSEPAQFVGSKGSHTKSTAHQKL